MYFILAVTRLLQHCLLRGTYIFELYSIEGTSPTHPGSSYKFLVIIAFCLITLLTYY